MNWRSPLWLSVLGLVLACIVVVIAGRRHSFSLDLVDEYTGGEGGVEEPADQPLD